MPISRIPNDGLSDATLRALGAYNSNGFLVQIAPDTFTNRSITVDPNDLVLTNADGVSANPLLQLAFRLKKDAATMTDWNNATSNGWFMGSSILNAPTTGWFIGNVENHGALGWCTQTVHDFTSAAAADGKRWRRHQTSGAWGSWYRIRDSETEVTAVASAAVTSGAATAALAAAATAAEYRANTNKLVSVNTAWNAAAFVTLTDAATITVDMSTFINAQVTLAGNRILGQPSNTKSGQTGVIRILQDAGGSKTLSYHADWEFPLGVAPTLSTAANAQDLLFYVVLATNRIYGTLIKGVI